MRLPRPRLRFLIPVTLFLVIGVFLYAGLFLNPREIPSPLIAKPVPEFSLPPLREGEPGLSSQDLRRGEASVVNFFASWCGPCRLEHPFITRLAEEGGVPVYGINYKDRPEDAIRWLDRFGDSYTRVGADRDGRVGIEWGVYGIPETFIIDREGRVACKHIGPIAASDLAEKILPAVEAARSGARVTC